VHTLFYTTNQLQHFGQYKTTPVVTRHVYWAQNITKYSFAPDPAGKAYLRAASRGRRKREKKQAQRNDEKGLLCPEFLTWKVSNPNNQIRQLREAHYV